MGNRIYVITKRLRGIDTDTEWIIGRPGFYISKEKAQSMANFLNSRLFEFRVEAYIPETDHEAQLDIHVHTINQIAVALGITKQPLEYAKVVERVKLLRKSHKSSIDED